MLKMIALLSTCLLWTTPALARYMDATVHERTLFNESWHTARLESICNPSWDNVQFRYCSSQSNACALVSPESLRYSDLDKYQEPMLRALSEFRKNLFVKLNSSYVLRLVGGPGKDHNLRALDQVIAEINTEGLKKWILLKSDREISPEFTSFKVANEVSATMAAVFSQPLKTTPVTPSRTGDEMANLPGDGVIR